MLGKRKSNRTVAPVKKRRKGEPPLEEIRFDSDAREEYLTGFHKRKLQRIKHAKEEALKKEREEKVAARKVVGPFTLPRRWSGSLQALSYGKPGKSIAKSTLKLSMPQLQMRRIPFRTTNLVMVRASNGMA